MAYRAIYRKWRPVTFEDVVGQAHITDTLKTELVTGKTAHAYLFCGTRGTGKTTTAKILSRAVNCENPLPDGNPCNECSACRGILNNTVMDVIEIDAASNNGVDNIRQLRDEVIYTPSEVKYKVYIIDEVHMLSGGAFNALLKTLEEPPAHVLFILATTEPHKIPATIQSRCQRFDFRRISVDNIAARITEIVTKDGISISTDAVRLVAELGDGSMRDALSVLDLCCGIDGEISVSDIENVTGAVSREFLYKLTGAVFSGDISTALSQLNTALINGREPSGMADELLGFLRGLLICKFSDNPCEILECTQSTAEKNKELVKNISNESIIHAVSLLSQTVYSMKTSGNQRAVLEAALVKICFPECDPSSDAFAARIKRLEQGAVPVAAPQKQQKPEIAPPVFTPPPAESIPMPEPPPVNNNLMPPVQKAEVRQRPAARQNGGNDTAGRLFSQYPYLRVLGENVQFVKQNDTMQVICETEEDAKAADNPHFVNDLQTFFGCKVRITHKGVNSSENARDPLLDLIEKAKQTENFTLL